LHSKERVPYHIIIEVAYDPEPQYSSEDDSNPDALGDNPFLEGNRHVPKGMLQKSAEKLKSLASISKVRSDSGRSIEL